MRRWWLFRLCATLLALWVPMVVGETAPVAHCAQHHPAARGPEPIEAAGHQHGAQPNQESQPCTCVDGCTIARAVFDVAAAPVVPVVIAVIGFEPPSPRWLPSNQPSPGVVYDATGPPGQRA